jgi:ribA/ribD-fused uncharacterized protein
MKDPTQWLNELKTADRDEFQLDVLPFYGGFMSQWHESPFILDRTRYPTAEHYMMACKAALFRDDKALTKILEARSPREAKMVGRSVRGYDEATWAGRRYAVAVQGNLAKFLQNPDLRIHLRNTGSRILVEASPTDRIWGVGLSKDALQVAHPLTWRGQNLLGFALMQVREQLAVATDLRR